jgi:hypothetical protein
LALGNLARKTATLAFERYAAAMQVGDRKPGEGMVRGRVDIREGNVPSRFCRCRILETIVHQIGG